MHMRMTANRKRALCLALMTATAALVCPGKALAVEGAMSPYLKGLGGFMSGILPPHEGTYVNNFYYGFDGEAGNNVRNGVVELNVDISLDAYLLQGLFVTDAKILGGTYAFGVIVDYVWAGLDADLTGPLGNTLSISLTSDGISDSFAYPIMLGWHDGNWHWNAAIGVLLPTGEYEQGQLNVGKNIWALIPQAAITYFDPESGWDISAAAAYVTMSRNDATDYQSGDIVHLDWAIGLHLDEAWEVGVAGNFVHQISGDSGTGARLGSFKAESIGIGPAVSYSTKIGEMPLSLSAKWEHDIHAERTFEGDVVNVTATIVF
jgi:hypothetical protein